jgi:hypothetical protein
VAVRGEVQQVARQIEADLGPKESLRNGGSQREIEASAEPGRPVTVGLDGRPDHLSNRP